MAAYKRNHPTIGVLTGWQVFSGVIDSFLEHVIRGIQAAAQDHKCNLLLACGSNPPISFIEGRPGWPIIDERVDFLPVGHWNCDGLIIAPTISVKACESYAVEQMKQGIPVIFAGSQGLGPGVAPDNTMGIRQAVRHLYEHGHRQIAFIAGFEFDVDGDSGSRLRAYTQAIQEVGLPFDPRLVAYGDHEIEKGKLAMLQILASRLPFSAVLASNDMAAMGAMTILREAGYQIPQDIALIGFDNRIETRAQVPPLSTIHFPMFELGYRSLEMMLDALDGNVKPKEVRLIPTHLVIRESCGCPPGKTGEVSQPHGQYRPVFDPTTSRPAVEEAPATGEPVLNASDPSSVVQHIASIIQTETHRMTYQDALLLTNRCVEAFQNSLVHGNPELFLTVFQEILDRVSACQNDLSTWQYAITVLRDTPYAVPEACLKHEEIDNMLDRARVMASEATRAQATRQLIRQAQVSERVAVMTNEFFKAQDEDEIFSILNQFLPSIGIEQNAVLYFQQKGEDPYALSALQSPQTALGKGCLFSTYQFPPPELFSDQLPFHYALLPIKIGQTLTGYTALKVGPLEPLADIVRQLSASLYAVHLRQEALNSQRMAEEANQLKSRFLSMVSHELRAPLNLITGLSDIILKSKNGSSLNDFSWDDLERIYTSSQHLDGLIQDVLDLAQSDIGQIKLTCEPLNLKEVLDSVSLICTNLIRDKGLAWCYEVDENLPPVWGDRTRIRQITLNLLNNAIKFTERGEISLKASLVQPGTVAVSVSDTGMGIPPYEQELIFEEFRQSERIASRGYGGLGLGLAICRRLVELHGGEILVSSSGHKDQGAKFTFTLPALEEQLNGSIRTNQLAQDTHVLLLAKNAHTSSILQGYLQERGHQVEKHAIGRENDWLSRVLVLDPDVVILDEEMTSESGWEVMKVLKEIPATREIPVLFYRVSDDGENGSFLELDYLSKPIKSAGLAETLLRYCVANHPNSGRIQPTILIVDDDLSTVELHTRLVLSQFPNARVQQAFNGLQALDLIQQDPPSLVLLDLLMPEMDGFAVLSAVRENKASCDIPIVVITSQSLNDHDIARLNQGVVSILGKNIFSQAETLAHISAYLQNHPRRGNEAQNAILKAMAFIHSHYKEPISRCDIATKVGLSERHLDRCFQQGLGISPITYLNRYRVNQARYLLETQKLGITAIAMEVGFSSSGYFARVFRDEMGISPRDYLQNKHSK